MVLYPPPGDSLRNLLVESWDPAILRHLLKGNELRHSFTSRPPAKSRRFQARAALPSTTWLAVTQQGAAFAALVVGEGFYTRSQLEQNVPGRPSVLPIVAGSLGLIAALGFLKLGNETEQIGLIVGGTSSAILLALNIKRSIDTKGDPREWPGPKVWPIFVSTGAFFATLAFFQALQYL